MANGTIQSHHRNFEVVTVIISRTLTGNILNANYASWMGLAWNGFHALKWALLDRQLKLWSTLEEQEIRNIENLASQIANLEKSVATLPV